MTTDPQTRNLLTCALLHLDHRIVDKRLALHGLLVEVGLYSSDHPCTFEQLQVSIDQIVGQRRFLEDSELHAAIKDCSSRQTVTTIDDKYELAQSAKDATNAAFQEADAVRQRVFKGLIESIELEVGKNLDPPLDREIYEFIERILASEIYELSIHLAREKVTMEDMLLRLDSVDPFQGLDPILDAHISTERELLREQIRFGIRNYFRSLNTDLQSFLRIIHHSVLINQILNLDPLMVHAQRKWFSNRRLYLDTNVVLSYLFEGQLLHPIVKEVIDATRNLDVQLFISPITLNELAGQVERARHNFKKLKDNPLVQRMAAIGDDAILATFIKVKRQQTSLEWGSFIAQFEKLEATLFDYGILTEEEGFEEALSFDAVDGIRKVVADVKGDKGDSVIDHDTLNCALVAHLRSKYPPDERGHQVWLLTIDRSLGRVQKILLGANTIDGPYCMQVEDWGEIALPAQSILEFIFDDFIGYLAQAKLGALADQQIVQLNFLETIQNAKVDVDRLLHSDPENVRAALVKLQVDQETRRALIGAMKAVDPGEKLMHQNQFDLKVEEALEKTDPVEQVKQDLGKRLDLLNMRLEDRDQTISRLQDSLQEVEANPGFRLFKWISGLFVKRK